MSKVHIKNRDIIAGELKVAGGYETEASKCVESMNKSVIDKLTVLFRNAHAFDTDSDDYSDNDEDYEDEGKVYRVMYRDGIIEE
jgi:hypothetical protein